MGISKWLKNDLFNFTFKVCALTTYLSNNNITSVICTNRNEIKFTMVTISTLYCCRLLRIKKSSCVIFLIIICNLRYVLCRYQPYIFNFHSRLFSKIHNTKRTSIDLDLMRTEVKSPNFRMNILGELDKSFLFIVSM